MLSVLSVALTVGMLLGSVTYPAVKKYVTGKQILLLSAGVIALFYIGLPVLEPFFHSGICRFQRRAWLCCLCGGHLPFRSEGEMD